MACAQPARAELLNYNKAGKAYWVEAELVPFTDADGRQTHWVAVEREIDERKRSRLCKKISRAFRRDSSLDCGKPVVLL